jgi:alginate O-acetyltransferase complex protein AlgI
MFFIPAYILILAATIIVDYFAGILIARSSGIRRKLFLVMSIVVNVGFLAFFKYFNFLNDNLALLAKLIHWNYSVSSLMIILPIGLSFHTFQAMSYTIEVYRGNQEPEKHFGIYALYVMFYPQLVAGPIERPQHLLHQFYEVHTFEYQRVVDGLKLMAWGLFKKVVIADRLTYYVDTVYNNPLSYNGLSYIIATVFFSFQIYCDFSGYSDIAIGSAQVMGFNLMDNFRRPYFSKTISEFWKRWHISLSTWFRDYLYIPLGGNRVSTKLRWYFNLFIVFFISGLWHGANWTFLIWGALHGTYLIAEILTEKFRIRTARLFHMENVPTIHKFVKVLMTFSLVSFSWIFFRAKNVHDALHIVTNLFSGIPAFAVSLFHAHLSNDMINQIFLGKSPADFLIAILCILFLEFVHFQQRHRDIRHMLHDRPFVFKWAVYSLIILGIIFLGVYEKKQFIYFQF